MSTHTHGTPTNPRIALVDDHAIVRAGVRRLLEAHDFPVVAEAADYETGLRTLRACAADIAIVDLIMPGGSGLELVRRVRAHRPELALIAFSMVEDQTYCGHVLDAGARGFVSKSNPPDLLVAAVRAVHAGRRFLSPDLEEARRNAASTHADPLRALSSREVEVLRLLAQGNLAEDIARVLGVSPKTVSNCQSGIKEKLGVRSTAALVHLAIGRGLVAIAAR